MATLAEQLLPQIFLQIVNMSITAGWLIFAVLLLRKLLKKAPKSVCCVLWAFVAVRLVCPFSPESFFSLIPSSQPIRSDVFQVNTGVHLGVPALDPVGDATLNLSDWEGTTVSAKSLFCNPLFLFSVLWLAGVVVVFGFGIWSVLRLRRKIRMSVPYQKGVLLCDTVQTPFIFGIFRPKIYLPSNIDSAQVPYVLAHERAHLSRKDHLWKPLAYGFLAVYWFHPLCWLGYFLFCRDMEFACDERVVKNWDFEKKREYSQTLLNLSVNRRTFAVSPLTFGEVGVKERIRAILHYKKPTFWMIFAAVILCAVTAVCFLTHRTATLSPENDGSVLLETGSDYSGVTLEARAVSGDAAAFSLEIVWKNSTLNEFMYGEPFDIYRWEENDWQRVEPRPGHGFSMPAYMVPPYSSRTHTYRPFDTYDLTVGKYRLVTEFFFEGKEEEIYRAWVDFDLETLPSLEGNRLRKYVYQGSEDVVPANFVLEEGNRFLFTFSAESSYVGVGTYEINGDKLILRTNDGAVYFFFADGDGYVFDAENSSGFRWGADFENGSVFR